MIFQSKAAAFSCDVLIPELVIDVVAGKLACSRSHAEALLVPAAAHPDLSDLLGSPDVSADEIP